MAQVIDTLEVLIAADASGLESQLKRAGKTVTSFVQEMNQGTINWKSIFSKTLSSAVISGIAATVALAITKALSIEGAMKDATAAGTNEFQKMGDKMGSVALGISGKTTPSFEEIAKASAYVSKNFKDVALQTTVLDAASKLATAGWGDVNTIAMQLADTLTNWGIDSAPKASEAIDALVYATRNGKFSFSEITAELTKTGIALRDSTNISEASIALARFSTVSGQTKETAVNAFEAIADAVLIPENNLKAIHSGFGNIKQAVEDKGITGALKLLDDHIKTADLTTIALAGNIGILPKTVKAFVDTSSKDIDAFTAQVKKDGADIKDALNKTFEESLSTTDKLSIAWKKFTEALGKAIVSSGLLEGLQKVLDFITKIIEGWTKYNEFLKSISPQNIVGTIADKTKDWMMEKIFGKSMSAEDYLAKKDIAPLLPKLNETQFTNFLDKARSGGLTNESISAGIQGRPSAEFSNVFNITAPSGTEQMISENIVKKLYNQFQGVQ